MLLRFSAENFKSLRDRQELSLVASSLRNETRGLIPFPTNAKIYALPAAVIYGANASGKSTLVSAFVFMRRMVMDSHKDSSIGRTPHALDDTVVHRPTRVEADFFYNTVRYQYGFALGDEGVITEWLHAFPRGRLQKLFTRSCQDFEFSRSLKGRTQVISELTPPTSLYLSSATQTGHELLTGISQFFRSWATDTDVSTNSEIAKYTLALATHDERTLEFLKAIGTGVVQHRTRHEEMPAELAGLMKDFLALARERFSFKNELPNFQEEQFQRRLVLELAHKARDGKMVYFDLTHESDGTIRLLKLLGLAFQALDSGSLLIVDELDSSLHTQACEQVLSLFCNKITNPKGAQLIATTHDTNLLNSAVLRRDEVWFAQKDDEGASAIYPLTDIRTRMTDNIEKGYLEGRYGAVPAIGRPKVRYY